jgi:hypothetical protein
MYSYNLFNSNCFLKTFPHVLESPKLQSFKSMQIIPTKKMIPLLRGSGPCSCTPSNPGGCFRVCFDGCYGRSGGCCGPPSDSRSTTSANSTVELASQRRFELELIHQLDGGGGGISIDARGRRPTKHRRAWATAAEWWCWLEFVARICKLGALQLTKRTESIRAYTYPG